MSSKSVDIDHLKNILLSLKSVDLKAFLKQYSYKSSGLKSVLIQRSLYVLRRADDALFNEMRSHITTSFQRNEKQYYRKINGLDIPLQSLPSSKNKKTTSEILLPQQVYTKVKNVIIRNESLVNNVDAVEQEKFFMFSLNEMQKDQIASNGKRVQLRICSAEHSFPEEDMYPPNCRVIMNGLRLNIPNSRIRDNGTQEIKKPHLPLDVTVTSYCSVNTIKILWTKPKPCQDFVAAIHLVEDIPIKDLVNKVEGRKKDVTLDLVNKQAQNSDVEVALTKVSLRCPISMARMKIPSRGDACDHLQCFDTETYISINQKKPVFLCPVCRRHTTLDTVYTDTFFIDILKRTSRDEICIFKDGSVKAVKD